jgi:hypothetical protein
MLEQREGGCHCRRVRFRAHVDLESLHAFYVPRSQPDRITANARCLDGIDGPSLKPTRFFDGRHWEEAQRGRIAEGGHMAAAGLNGAVTLKNILDRAPE